MIVKKAFAQLTCTCTYMYLLLKNGYTYDIKANIDRLLMSLTSTGNKQSFIF